MEKMLLIDGNSLVHRAFHALPPLRSSKGIYTNAVFGFINMFFRLLKEQNPDYVMVAFDKKGPTFRQDMYSEYKATRPRTPDELIRQFDLLKDVLNALNVSYVEKEGLEADDLLGIFSKKAEDAGLYTIIVTGDKDALQLVSDLTHVMLTIKGISKMELYDTLKVIDRYGVEPERITDLKALKGDTSDNIPGIPGIGLKTASKLIKQFGSVENLLKSKDELKGKIREGVMCYEDQILMSKKLATIVRELDVECDFSEFGRKSPDYDRLLKLFREMEFHSLISKIEVRQDKKEANHEQITSSRIKTTDDMEKAISVLENSDFLAILIKTAKISPALYDILEIGFSTAKCAYYLKKEELDSNKDIRSLLKNFVEHSSGKIITHDWKLARCAFKSWNINFGCKFDTMLAAYLLNPSKSSYDIENIAYEYLGKELQDIQDFGLRALALIQLKDFLAEQLDDVGMHDLFENVEMPLGKVLSEMETVGIKADKQKLEVLSAEFGRKMSDLTNEIYELAGIKFNINSPKQLGEVLFEKLHLPVVKKTKTGYSTDADVLEKLKSSHPIVEKILRYRFLMKLKSTYADGLLAVLDKETEKIHTHYNQTVTSTGRISSTEPNLQNIPVKTDEGRRIRSVFSAENPDRLLLSGDYSQIELRVLAHVSGDTGLIEAFKNNDDIHTRTASEVFGVPKEDVSYELRDKAKAVNFGIVYGISEYGLAQGLGITNSEAKEYIEAYFKRYQGVRDYVRNTIKQAKTRGYVTTIFNRRRYLPDINSKNYNIRSFAERAAMNTPIQGSAADIIKIAMIKVYEYLEQNNLKTKLVLQIHDELILDVPKNELSEVKQAVKHHMENAVLLKVPLLVDLKQAYTWGEL
jgi:DNA polymerase-1